LAQVDKFGNLNVSKFGKKLSGCGGFINISQNSKKCIFVGTFTADGLKINLKNGKLEIIKEGKTKKFVNKVEQITFSGKIAQKNKQQVMYITERCVFKLTEKGMELIEIAPGIDIDKNILKLMDFKPIISKQLKEMDNRIFINKPMKII
jgi:propionate CoA-transferase